MELRTLGRTGVKVSPLCLGAMMFGAWGNPDHDDSVRIIHRALDAGINFIDTADVYSAGESEEIVGKALSTLDRERVVLATKVHGTMGDDPNAQGNSRRWIIAECENSLRRLGTDYIDLYQIHRPDPSADIDETLGALTDLVRAGKIRYFGSSTSRPTRSSRRSGWPSAGAASASSPSSRRTRCWCGASKPTSCRSASSTGWGSSPGARWPEAGCPAVSDRARTTPAAGRRGSRTATTCSCPGNQPKLEIVDELAKLAAEAGLTLVELALAFVLEHPAVSSAIIGPRTMEQLETQLRAPDVRLDSAILDRIDEIVPPGTNLNRVDAGWGPPSLTDATLRRRR